LQKMEPDEASYDRFGPSPLASCDQPLSLSGCRTSSSSEFRNSKI
jgi:hypothetical protein